MEKLKMALIGCGGMGTRHLYGLSELAKTPFNNIELVALCDLSRENAELAADEAEKLLGKRPPIFTNMEKMVQDIPDLMAVDVVTDPSVHHTVVCHAFELGLHVLVEKPMAISVRACKMMMDAARRNGCKLSVAENYRRDPSSRLTRHLLDTGRIGNPYMATLHSMRGGNEIFITPWRHLKDRGGPLVDMGVHYTDLIRYQLGDVEEVYGDARLVEPVRKKQKAIRDPYAFYQQRFKTMPDEVPATAEDTSMAMLRMKNGMMVSFIMGVGGHGACRSQLILGDKGSLQSFGNRGGQAIWQPESGEVLDQSAILEAISDFALDPLTDHFFPNLSSMGDEAVDWKLIAFEQHELARAVLYDDPIEVDGMEGLKDVALVYAICESARAGRTVTMAEVESGELYGYQAEIDSALGISA
ncbi:MAG: Gfo/Idh/MocA family oxidoreductase [bacterium]|nr:Gfo/Idh/MocA family oxidoreductase [bacterium]